MEFDKIGGDHNKLFTFFEKTIGRGIQDIHLEDKGIFIHLIMSIYAVLNHSQYNADE